MALCLAGVTVFAVLSWITLNLGTVLGGVYTGEQELVRPTIGFATVAGAYTIAACEIFIRRSSLRRVQTLRRTQGVATIVFLGILAFVIVFLSMYL
jgi:hypothetical protein